MDSNNDLLNKHLNLMYRNKFFVYQSKKDKLLTETINIINVMLSKYIWLLYFLFIFGKQEENSAKFINLKLSKQSNYGEVETEEFVSDLHINVCHIHTYHHALLAGIDGFLCLQ